MKASTQNRKDVSKQPLQRVYRVGQYGVALGLPADLEQACFLMAPGKDYTVANDFLYGLHCGAFDEYCLLDPPEWMNQRRDGPLLPRSLWSTAQALATGIDVLEARNLSFLEIGNSELKRIGSDLVARGVESGIGFVQSTVLKCSAWCHWRKLREPIKVSHGTILFRMGPKDSARARETKKVHAVFTQPLTTTKFISEIHIEAIIEEVMKTDDGHGPALRTAADAGLRGSEPGSILIRHMPRAGDVDPAQPAKFPLWGKGGKKRYPELPISTLGVNDRYRTGNRRLAVARAIEKGGKEPEELFLKRDGTPITYASLRRAFKKACKALGIEGRLHWLRHSFAANYLAKGAMDMWTVARRAGVTISFGELTKLTEARQFSLMKLLGHKSIATTEIYLEHVHRVLFAKMSAAVETMH